MQRSSPPGHVQKVERRVDAPPLNERLADGPEDDLPALIRAERIGLVFRNTRSALFGNLLVAFLGLVILWPHVAPAISLAWLLGLLTILTIRWRIKRAYARQTGDHRVSMDVWGRRLFVVLTLTGFWWGGFSLLLLVHADAPQTGFVSFIIGGMMAAAVATLGPLRSVYLGFTLPMIACLFGGLIWRGGHESWFMVSFAAAFEITMIATVWQISGIVSRNIELRLQNEGLVRSLTRINAELAHEIEERRDAEARSAFLATHDALTGLPNRRMQEDRFVQALGHAARGGGLVAILFIDLDRFKQVNDTLGHAAGDSLLRVLAGRLRECLRSGDSVCRQGGDEFLVLLVDIAGRDGIAAVAERIVQSLRDPVELAGEQIQVGCSIGISLYPDDGDDFELLVSRADQALYQAKHQGRNSYRFFLADRRQRDGERS